MLQMDLPVEPVQIQTGSESKTVRTFSSAAVAQFLLQIPPRLPVLPKESGSTESRSAVTPDVASVPNESAESEVTEADEEPERSLAGQHSHLELVHEGVSTSEGAEAIALTTPLVVEEAVEESTGDALLPDVEERPSVVAAISRSALSRGQAPMLIRFKPKPVQQIEPKILPQEDSDSAWTDVEPLSYEARTVERTDVTGGALGTALYEVYQPQRIAITGAMPHPTTLCESVALASVRPPLVSYRPWLPKGLVDNGVLSEAQLESIIYAGEAHSGFLTGVYRVEDSFDSIEVCSAEDPLAVQFRRGWFLGDGTGAGKGRQVAGVILDNWCQGRRKALWVSKSDKLLEDAQRDWQALGGDPKVVVPLSRFGLTKSIQLKEGILFTTYATLRGSAKAGKQSRLEQIVTWLGSDFEGVIAFDEAHAMGNALAEQGNCGMRKASQQGLSGLRLQNALPRARVLYVSATGATKVSNLAYASRLGLWQTGDFPFASRSEFISAIDAGGVAAMEVVCRDLKALGLYFARNLSFDGVEYEALEVPLTTEQVAIYDTYAEAFQVIHSHLEEALQICNVVSEDGSSLNSSAKMSARSAFESHKQRFFSHLLCSMKCVSLIRAIEQDLAEGHAVVIQVVSTNEALLQRRLADIPVEEHSDLNVDITPREYVMDYLVHAFPIHLYEVYSTEDGDLRSELVKDAEGNAVICQEALTQRDALIERIAALAPLPGALDQLLHHFGHDLVAEVTGRSLRVLMDPQTKRLFVNQRSAGTNLDETQAFMGDEKRILIFSDAGGTGRSYHADLNCLNTRRRVHYLLEAGWRADNAIQGLGRSHRTNQASAPVFRPVVTDVRGERRFISTIARRLDALGALTRGQRQTGGQGLFDPRDNLESIYAELALRQLFAMVAAGQVACCSLARFEAATGLSLSTDTGQIKETLPEIRQFLNRLLALPIGLQNGLFEVFELIVVDKIEAAMANGTFEAGVETLRAEKFRVLNREVICTHESGGETICVEIEETCRTEIISTSDALRLMDKEGLLVRNERSGRVAVRMPTSSTVTDEGAVINRFSLVRPTDSTKLTEVDYAKSHWRNATLAEWHSSWDAEVASAPAFTTRRFFLICGLLLPIWNSLDSENMRVFRLQTDTGERLLGRVIEPHKIQEISQALGLHNVALAPAEVFDLVMNQRQSVALPGGLMLRSALVMRERRFEIIGQVSDACCEQLKAAGCFTEIIQWRRRVFVPADPTLGVPVLERSLKLLR